MTNTQDSVSLKNHMSRLVDSTSYYIQVGPHGMTVQYGILLKIVLINQFMCDFIYACQVIWMANIITVYQASRFLNLTIWAIPFFISARIKPYLLVYGKQSPLCVSVIAKIIITCYAGIVFGQYFIIISTQPQRVLEIIDTGTQYKNLRVLFAFVGWTLTKIALETIYSFNEQLQSIVIYSNLQDDAEEVGQISLIAKVNAYLLCFFALLKVQNYRDYYQVLSQVYYVCTLLAISGMLLLHNSNNFKAIPRRMCETISKTFFIQKQPYSRKDSRSVSLMKNIKARALKFWKWLVSVNASARRYDIFNGYPRLRQSSFDLKIYLIILACTNIIKNTIKFSCVVWIVESIGKDKTLIHYKCGHQTACVLLSLFALSNYFVKKLINASRKTWKQSKTNRNIYEIIFIFITLLTVIASVFSIKTKNTILIYVTVLLCSFLVSNLQSFLQYDEPSINRFHPQFQICQNVIYNISNYIVILGVPIFVFAFGTQKSNINSFYFIAVSCILIMIVKLYYIKKVQKKQKKKEIKEFANIGMGKSQMFERMGSPSINMFASTRSSVVQPLSGRLDTNKTTTTSSFESRHQYQW